MGWDRNRGLEAGKTTEAACDSAAVDRNVGDRGPGYQPHGTVCWHPGNWCLTAHELFGRAFITSQGLTLLQQQELTTLNKP